MSDLRESIAVAAARLGLPGGAALVALAWAAWAQWIAVPEAERSAAALQEQQAGESARKAAAPPSAAPREVLAAVYAELPDDKSSNALLAGLLDRARAQGLAIDAVQFQTEPVRLPGVRRHRASLPLTGRYDVLRAWLAQTLHDQPSVTLDSLELKRKDAGADQLEARVVLSLWASERAPGRDGAGEGGHGR